MDYQIATAWLLVNFRGTSRNLAYTRQMALTVDDNIACFTERIVELLTRCVCFGVFLVVDQGSERNVHNVGANRPEGETSWGRTDEGAKRPVTSRSA